MRDTPEGIIEDLQIQALDASADTDIPADETLAWEAAETIRALFDALKAVVEGVPGAMDEARRVIDQRTYRVS